MAESKRSGMDEKTLVPKDHLLRSVERVMDYDWSTPKDCRNCPCREACGANAKGQRVLTTHIWQEYLDLAEQLRKSERGQEIYALRKETIERVFADAKDKHGMRFTHRRGLARVSSWVRLKFAAMNLKKLALWGACHSFLYRLSLAIFPFFLPFPWINRGFFDRQLLVLLQDRSLSIG